MEPLKLAIFSILIALSIQHEQHEKPHSVSGCYQGSLGTFYWTVSGDSLILNISAHVTEDEWAAIGFSKDSQMGQDDIVAIHRSIVSHTFVASSLINPDAHSRSVVQNTSSLTHTSVVYEDGEIEANITKSISLSSPITDLARIPVYILFAKGLINTDNASTPLHKHRELMVSRRPVLLSEHMETCIPMRTNIFFKIHGILMVIVWLNVTPLATFIARYAKYYFKKQALWFPIHKYSGLITGVVFLVSIYLAFLGANKEVEFHRHQLVGLAMLAVILLHILLALCRPDHDSKYRVFWEALHRIGAALLVTGSVFNICNGMVMLAVHEVCYWLLAAQVVTWCLIYLGMEYSTQVGRYVARVCRSLTCCPTHPTLYYSLGPRDKGTRDIGTRDLISTSRHDSDESECDDITMVTINLDSSAKRGVCTRAGIVSLLMLNTSVAIVLIVGLVDT